MAETAQDCQQLLENPTLDLVDDTIPGWGILDGKVYVTTQDYVSPQTALVMPDADEGDNSPEQDAFGQYFDMPPNLSQVTIDLFTATNEANDTDEAFGNLWTVDGQGNLEDFILSWPIEDSPGAWREESLTIEDAEELAAMAGQPMIIILFTDTNGQAPGEVVFLDDIRLTACTGTVPPTSTPTNTPEHTPTATPTNTPAFTPTSTPTPESTATQTPVPQGRRLNLPVVIRAGVSPPTPTPQPSPTPTATTEPSTGALKLYLRFDPDMREPYLSPEPVLSGSTQLFYYPNTEYRWEVPLTGDIDGSRYIFSIYLASSRTDTAFGVQLLANEVVLATRYFVAKSTTYERFTAEIDGVDPATTNGDTLSLRIWHHNGYEGGLLMGPPPNADSHIIIPGQR